MKESSLHQSSIKQLKTRRTVTTGLFNKPPPTLKTVKNVKTRLNGND